MISTQVASARSEPYKGEEYALSCKLTGFRPVIDVDDAVMLLIDHQR